MSYADNLNNLYAAVQEFAVIYHKIRLAEFWLAVSFILLAVAIVLAVDMFLIPSIKKALDNIEIPSEKDENLARAMAAAETRKPKYSPEDLADILEEFRK